VLSRHSIELTLQLREDLLEVLCESVVRRHLHAESILLHLRERLRLVDAALEENAGRGQQGRATSKRTVRSACGDDPLLPRAPSDLLMEYPKNSATICADPLRVMVFFVDWTVRDIARGAERERGEGEREETEWEERASGREESDGKGRWTAGIRSGLTKGSKQTTTMSVSREQRDVAGLTVSRLPPSSQPETPLPAHARSNADTNTTSASYAARLPGEGAEFCARWSVHADLCCSLLASHAH
jgi:hypothetical protein